jgi:hypothetical protein
LFKEVFGNIEKNGEIKLSMDAFINFILEAWRKYKLLNQYFNNKIFMIKNFKKH